MLNIIHHNDKNCFIANFEGSEAVLEYQMLGDGVIDFTRTFVPNQLRGKGLAEKLVRAGLSWARGEGFSIQASCWYVEKFLRLSK